MAEGYNTNLFAPIQAPRLKSISRKAIQEFLASREAYEDAVAAQKGLNPVSIRASFPDLFLRSLVKARVFGANITDVNDLRDEIIKTKLKELSSDTKAVSKNEALADVKKHVCLDASKPDARLRILMLSASYIELCEKRGWNFVENSQRAAVQHIISVLQPQRLKQRMQDAIELERVDLADDYYKFIDFVAEKAEVYEEVLPLNENLSMLKTDSKKVNNVKLAKKSNSNHHELGSSSSKHKSKKKSSLPDCLNPDCDEKHLVRNCPKTSKELAHSLLKAYRSSKKSEKNEDFIVGAFVQKNNEQPAIKPSKERSSSDRATVIAELYNHTFACRIDSGADEIVVSDTIIDFLNSKDIFVPMRKSNTEHNFTAAGGHPITSVGQVIISPTLRTAAGPCTLRNIKAHIVEDQDISTRPGASCPGEIILGNPFLVRSGLNVKDFIANNIDSLASIDYSDLNETKPKSSLGKLGIRLITENSSNEDYEFLDDVLEEPTSRLCNVVSNGDFPLKDGDDVNYKDVDVGIQDSSELESAIESMKSRASKRCPKPLRPKLMSIVDTNADIFRARLGDDPPVKVRPMVIEFENEPKPIKVRQRTYSPEQLEFMKKKVEELIRIGYIHRNSTWKWACAPIIVPKGGTPKPGKERFRFVVDLRPINAQTKRNVWPMPNTDAMLAKLSGAKFFFAIDFLHGYWQFPLDENSQEFHSFHHPSEYSHLLVCYMEQVTPQLTFKKPWSPCSTTWTCSSGLMTCWDTQKTHHPYWKP